MKNKPDPDIEFAKEGLPPCLIYVDREGEWRHRGSLMHRNDIVAHLCQHLGRDHASGRYTLQIGKQRCYLEVEDVPLVITRVSIPEGERPGAPEKLLLTVKHLEGAEVLDPQTLWVGKENVLYCNLTAKGLPARFTRPAYYQLAEFIHEDPERGGFYLFLKKEKFYIEQRTPAQFAQE